VIRRLALVVATTALALFCTACSADTRGAGHGTAIVDYAGSLSGLVQSTLQPSFEKTSGDRVVGLGEGSSDIAQGINDGELDPGAFVSIGAAPIESIWPGHCRFVMELATDRLVIAYSQKSRYASELNAIRSGKRPLKSLFELMAEPRFRLGRTDPIDDPQGAYFLLMIRLATAQLHLPASLGPRILGTSARNDIGNAAQIVSEDALPTDIASGSVDAGSDFLPEAKQYHLDYIALPAALDFADPAKAKLYDATSLKLPDGAVFAGGLITLDATLVRSSTTARSAAADEAWMVFLLSRTGRRELRAAGYDVARPTLELAPGVASATAALPRALLRAYRAARRVA
jgi:molybdate/tungstate transport system substrate-binding protein